MFTCSALQGGALRTISLKRDALLEAFLFQLRRELSMGAFKEAHGGVLKEGYLGEKAAQEERGVARDYVSWDLTPRQLCDIELVLSGAFSPLRYGITSTPSVGCA